MNKQQIIHNILTKLTQELAATIESANAAADGATHEDAVAKSKYDTHGLELSYLAGSQFERARQLQQQLLRFTRDLPNHHTGQVSVGSLVSLRRGTQKYYLFLSPVGASLEIVEDGHKVWVISPDSPLGQDIVGLHVGDEVSRSGIFQNCEIIAID